MTCKYRCFGSMNGTPVTTKKKRNPAQLRRSKLRQEEFFRKKREAADSGTQKSGGSLPDPVVGQQQLVEFLSLVELLRKERMLRTQPLSLSLVTMVTRM